MDILSVSVTLFLIMDPFGNIPVFLPMLEQVPPARRRLIIARELLIALAVIVLFIFCGRYIMNFLGLDQAAVSIAGGINVEIANGNNYGNWRAGWTNVAAGDSFVTSWQQTIPALGSAIGTNICTLEAVDVTPTPYNQPPYPPSGDSATAGCTVTGMAP